MASPLGKPHRFITIRFSHYNERARWGLDRFSVPYREQGMLPMFHFGAVFLAVHGRPAAHTDSVSTRFSTPLLITPEGQRIADSGEIVRYAAERFGSPSTSMHPVADVASLERRFHDELGPSARLLAYTWILPDAELMKWVADRNVSRAQALAFRASYFALRASMIRALGLRPERARKAESRVRKIFDDVSRRIEGKPFLVGDTFTAADLTFASLASLVVGVTHEDGYGAVLPPIGRCPSIMQRFVHELRATPAGLHALRMYHQQRRVVVGGGA